MKIFFRLLLTFWAVMLVLTLIIVFVSPFSSSMQDERVRALSLNTLQDCARRAADLYHAGGPAALHHQDPACHDGLLLPPGAIPDAVPDTDLAGRALTREDRLIVRRAQNQTDIVLITLPRGTILALRSNPASPASEIYLATIPAPQHRFSTWRVNMIIRLAGISGLFALLVTAYFARPIARLNRAAEQFGAGNLKARTPPSLARRKDELGDLGRTFNQMAERIESLVVRYKSFLAHASHELGSPLTRLNIALALARRKAGHQLEPEHDRIALEANRLNSLVQELLLLARLESGNELSRNSIPFEIGPLVDEACADASFEAANSGKTVAIVRQEAFVLRGYPDLLRRALDNLLRNALRFTSDEGRVEVSYFRKSNPAIGVILVSDDGPGIAPGQEESIFEPFITLPDNGDHLPAGSGLGLAIARQAIFANKGTIRAQNGPIRNRQAQTSSTQASPTQTSPTQTGPVNFGQGLTVVIEVPILDLPAATPSPPAIP